MDDDAEIERLQAGLELPDVAGNAENDALGPRWDEPDELEDWGAND